MSDFRFKIGDKVAHANAVAMLELGVEAGFPTCFTVCERIAQECPGGVQLQYRIGDVPPARLVLEHELVPWAEAVEATKAARAQSRAAREADDKAAWDRIQNLTRNTMTTP